MEEVSGDAVWEDRKAKRRKLEYPITLNNYKRYELVKEEFDVLL